MTHLLFLAILFEASLILFLLFKTPLRKLSILFLDRLKRGRGPIVVKTVCGTLLVVLGSGVHSMSKIRKRGAEYAVGPTDQVLMAKHMLETTLLGAILFLTLMTDRLHHYIRELRLRRKGMEAAKTMGRGFEDEKKTSSLEDVRRSLEEETRTLQEKVGRLESDLAAKAQDVNAAEASAIALRKQSEGFLLEYDRLLEENQNLRRQLQVLDRRFSLSGSKKNS